MADEGKRKRCRPPVVLTESARKRRRQQQAEAYSRSRIIIGNEIGRWKELKKDEGPVSNFSKYARKQSRNLVNQPLIVTS